MYTSIVGKEEDPRFPFRKLTTFSKTFNDDPQ